MSINDNPNLHYNIIDIGTKRITHLGHNTKNIKSQSLRINEYLQNIIQSKTKKTTIFYNKYPIDMTMM